MKRNVILIGGLPGTVKSFIAHMIENSHERQFSSKQKLKNFDQGATPAVIVKASKKYYQVIVQTNDDSQYLSLKRLDVVHRAIYCDKVIVTDNSTPQF